MKRILSLFIFICLLLLISILHIDNLAFNSKVEFVFEYLSVLVIVAIAITGYSAFRS